MEKTGVITDEDVEFAARIVAAIPGAFLGGSYVVKGRAAHDIDVIVPSREWTESDAKYFAVERVVPNGPVPEDDRLVGVWRRGNVDVIVVADEYEESYRRAVKTMAANPERYAERPARVAIHIHYADEVRLERGIPLERELKASGGGGGDGGYDT